MVAEQADIADRRAAGNGHGSRSAGAGVGCQSPVLCYAFGRCVIIDALFVAASEVSECAARMRTAAKVTRPVLPAERPILPESVAWLLARQH